MSRPDAPNSDGAADRVANDNPYRPPRSRDRRRYRSNQAAASAYAECVQRTWSSRLISILSPVNATVRYCGFGIGERVYVNGRQAAHASSGIVWRVAPTIAFEIPDNDDRGDRWQAQIEVTASILTGRILSFRLVVADETVYVE